MGSYPPYLKRNKKVHSERIREVCHETSLTRSKVEAAASFEIHCWLPCAGSRTLAAGSPVGVPPRGRLVVVVVVAVAEEEPDFAAGMDYISRPLVPICSDHSVSTPKRKSNLWVEFWHGNKISKTLLTCGAWEFDLTWFGAGFGAVGLLVVTGAFGLVAEKTNVTFKNEWLFRRTKRFIFGLKRYNYTCTPPMISLCCFMTLS